MPFADEHRYPAIQVEERTWKAEAEQVLPLSQYDTSDPEGLWQRMSDTEKKIGGRLLAIPHNGNLSGGVDVRFGSVADIEARLRVCRVDNVCPAPESRHGQRRRLYLLGATSGHD